MVLAGVAYLVLAVVCFIYFRVDKAAAASDSGKLLTDLMNFAAFVSSVATIAYSWATEAPRISVAEKTLEDMREELKKERNA